MEPVVNPFIHEYHNQTTLHAMGLVAVIVLGLMSMVVRRQYAIWPLIAMACFISPAQRIVVLGADFTMLRLMLLFTTVRLIARQEYKGFAWKPIDIVFLSWVSLTFSMPMLRLGPDVLMNRLGVAYDAAGVYFVSRLLIRSFDDLRSCARGFAWVSVPVAAAFLVELSTGRNLFAVFGGVNEITQIREGRLRCQGAFAHPILAGCFWASALPLIAAAWWDRRQSKALVLTSVTGGLVIIFACASSTPIVAVVVALAGACCFPLRRWIRVMYWTGLALLLGLHLGMDAPVWHLITRISVVAGSTGYHRYQLIQNAIKHVDEWWLVGSSRGTAHWGHQMFDVTNLYIVQALHGGLLQITVFVAVIAVAFRAAGRIWRAEVSQDRLVLAWALGTALLVHATSFLAVSYFGQIWMSWYLVLGVIASLDPGVRSRQPQATRQPLRVSRTQRPGLVHDPALPAVVRVRQT